MSDEITRPRRGGESPAGFSFVGRLVTPAVLVAGMALLATFAMARGNEVFERVVTVLFINLLLAVALQIFMGNSGLGSFGQYAFVTIGAYASLWFSLTPKQKSVTLPDMPEEWWLHAQHTPFVVAILIAAALASVVGGLIGVPLVRLRGASFTIATFALLIVVNRVALQWSELTRGSRVVIGIPKLTDLWVALGWAAVAVVIAYAFKESPIGLKLRASREDEDAAASLGVNPALMRWVAWTVSVGLSGLGGALWAHFIQQFQPSNFYLKETFLIVAMLIIGGSGSVSGAVIGAIVVALVQEQLRQAEVWINSPDTIAAWLGRPLPFSLNGFADIVLALAIILVLVWRPTGLTRGREITLATFRRRPAPPRRAEGEVGAAVGEVP